MLGTFFAYEKYTCSIYINYSSLNRCGLFDLYINTIGKGGISREVNSFPARLSSSLKYGVEGGGGATTTQRS